ncbi:MAG: hypothetical protein GXP49_15065 [Deltaproteobacteria bacterium]|nr:hypothetical protein [Deltaproteobacteria bacterium]
MKARGAFIDFILKKWLAIASGVGFTLTSLYIGHVPKYSTQEIEVLFILFTLFVAVKGLHQSGLISKAARAIEKGTVVPLKLVVTTFFLSMLVTNDIALIIMVPLTLSINIRRKDLLVILEALAANAGSALTPIGNPQNLFLYWFYQLHPLAFIETIAPFSLTFLVILIAASLLIKAKSGLRRDPATQEVNNKAYIYSGLLFVVLLTVFHVLPVWAALLVVFFALLFDRKSLGVDYSLLLSFFFFFGLAENMKMLLAPEISRSGHVFLFSALLSQFISNVPAALLFAKFTNNWSALLWGTNAGGFGSLFGSLANLIAYKVYLAHEGTENAARFTLKFIILGYAAFFISMGLYFSLH